MKPAFEFEGLLENTILPVLGTDPTKLKPETLATALASVGHRLVQCLYQEAIGDVVRRRWQTTGIEDSALADKIEEEFVPWLLQSIEHLATSRNVAVRKIPSFMSDWAPDLERQRLSLRSSRSGGGYNAINMPAA